jgi:uncharacterized protein (DUF4213/DUF364 family)
MYRQDGKMNMDHDNNLNVNGQDGSPAISGKAAQIYRTIRERFLAVLKEHDVKPGRVRITSQGLSPEEAIGRTDRTDMPILTGKEIMLQASYEGSRGQAFTDAPALFEGPLDDILAMDLERDPHARGLYLAAMNAVLRHLGCLDHTVHCKDMEPKDCSGRWLEHLKEKYDGGRVALVGYQPWLFQAISADDTFALRVLDLNPDNVGAERFGVVVEHGIDDYREVVREWADVVLCTSSVFANATMDRYIDIGTDVLFYGISGAGAIYLLGLQRFCPLSA